MPAIACTTVSLRFFCDDLDPDQLTRLLGASPSQVVRKGDARPSGFIERSGSWRLKAPASRPGDLDHQIMSLLQTLTDDLGVWAQLTSRFDADLFCGLFMEERNEGLNLKSATLAAIGARGLRLALDIYDPTED